MIDVKELRIGNWIYANPALLHPNVSVKPSLMHVSSIEAGKIGVVQHNLEYRVEPFEDDVVVMEVPHLLPEELEPIPLSDLWLQNFGFINTAGGWLIKDKNAGEVKLSASFKVEFGNSPALQVTTVHQLQNLYFALTTHELEIKE